MRFNIQHLESSWTLFFSWGGFVFLSINFFTGMLLSNIDINSFIFVNIIALILLSFTLYPTVYISIKYNVNYSESIQKFIHNKTIAKFLILLVILINIGWYAIQLTAIQNIVLNTFNFKLSYFIIIVSYIFAYGSYKFEYQWLKYFSIMTMILFLAYIIVLFINFPIALSSNTTEQNSISYFNLIIMLYGTWAFSSSTIVMDIAKYTSNFKKSYLYILLATICSNFILIALGYIFARYTNINSFDKFVTILGMSSGFFLFILNIWSTNDSNFFSSMKAAESLNIKKEYAFIFIPLLSALMVVYYHTDLFDIIGSWLKLMGWVAIPLTLFWWYILIAKIKIPNY